MEAGSSFPPDESDSGYGGAAIAGAPLTTVFVPFLPFLALIAALLSIANQTEPRKRSQLRTWAWISGGLLAFEAFVLVVLASVTL
jgi:hypothetical protein